VAARHPPKHLQCDATTDWPVHIDEQGQNRTVFIRVTSVRPAFTLELVITELEVEQDYLRRAMRYSEE
jgi:hypothetical protein